jgi:hypothetical protein
MEATLPAQTPYRHTQIGYATLLGLFGGLVTQLGGTARDVRLRKKRACAYLPASLFFLASMAAFSTLTVEVAEGAVSAGFTGGLFRRRFELHLIEAADVVTVPWYSGWGIRLTPDGWLYSVWGRRAVRLRMSDGATFTVGTDEPETLLAAIERARARQA